MFVAIRAVEVAHTYIRIPECVFLRDHEAGVLISRSRLLPRSNIPSTMRLLSAVMEEGRSGKQDEAEEDREKTAAVHEEEEDEEVDEARREEARGGGQDDDASSLRDGISLSG